MIVLGLETSSAVCSVGVVWENGKRVQRSLLEGRVHSEKLLALVQQALTDGNVRTADLDAVAVSGGPGSFTGLRIGMSSAKGLSRSLDVPLVVVPTFDGLAESVRMAEPGLHLVLIALDARQGDYYCQLFNVNASRADPAEAARTADKREILDRLRNHRPDLLVTDVVGTGGEWGDVRVADARPHFRGDVIAALGMIRLTTGKTADAVDAEPFYLKDFIVRRHGSGSREVPRA